MKFQRIIYLTVFLSGIASAVSLDTIRQEAARRTQADQFSGVILITRDGKPVVQHAYGHSDRDRKISNELETKFPIGKHLPDYPNEQVASATIEQLLTHTGATGDFFGPDYFERRGGIREHQDYLNLIGSRGLLGTPGSRWNYSNYGMILLGRIIEVVSQQSYADYTRTHIFEPLGMRDTGNEPESSSVPRLSIGYTHMGSQPGPPVPLHSNVDALPYRGTAAGGGYTTAGDLLKFSNALTSHQVLDEAHTKLLLSPRIATARPGYFPESKELIVVLANLDPPSASELARFIVEGIHAPVEKPTPK